MPTFTTKVRNESAIIEGTIDAETREAAVAQLVASVPDDGSAIDILEVTEQVPVPGPPAGTTGATGTSDSAPADESTVPVDE